MGTARLLKLLSLLTGISLLQQVRGWVITVPKTMTAVEGSCVVVPCKTQPHSRVNWCQYHPTKCRVVYDRDLLVEHQFKGRTSVVGKAAEGKCTLKIDDVRRADNNIQVYARINPDSSSPQKFHLQTVTISVIERKAPIISMQKQIMDGDILQANCSIIHSCPSSPPSLRWSKSQFLKNSTIMAFSQEMQEQGQWSYTETLQGIATYEMHHSSMMCEAQFSSFTTASQQITLDMLYKPVTVTLKLAKKAVTEGSSVTVECAASCNPPPDTYTWLKREMGHITKISSTLSKKPFINITRNTFILCIARNNIGEGQSDWLDLDVQYAPVILPKSYCHLTGEVLKCVCQVEAHPDALIHWTIDGNDTLPSSFSTFSTNQTHVLSGVISGPAQSHSDVFCTATNTLGSSTKKLSVNLSETSSLSAWLTVLIILGFAVLFGCTVLIFKKYSRPAPGSVCNNTILLRPQGLSDSVQPQSSTYNIPQRSEEEDSQSSPRRPERNPEVESRVSDIYDNDCVTEMRLGRAQQLHNKETAHLREGQKQPLAKAVDCNMDVYLNC